MRTLITTIFSVLSFITLIVKEDMSEITFFKVTDDLVTYKYFTKFTSNIIKN